LINLSDLEWRRLVQPRMIDRALARPAQETVANTFRKAWGSASRPVMLLCDDRLEYVVKGSQAGRMIFNDHVVAWLGAILGAPTGMPRIIDVPARLIALEPQMAHMASGLAHGTHWVPGCTEAESIQYTTLPENRGRFAALAVLYGWVSAGNEQFIYKTAPPNLVISVDHGHFFPNGPDWTIDTLAVAPPPQLNPLIAGACAFTQAELAPVAGRLRTVSDTHIAAVVGRPPAGWNVSRGDRIALADYLATRRDLLLHTLAVP
jgi:hypothetical protein